MTDRLSRAGAEKLDEADPLAAFRDRFVIDDPFVIYMDGNSLGRLSIATERRLTEMIRLEWGGELIRGWDHWLTLPQEVGDRLGASLLGAAPGQVVVSDSTTVNLYKCAVAALDARGARRVIVTDSENFPTDRYVFEGLAHQRGLTLRMVPSHPVDGLSAGLAASAIDEDVALVSFSHVAYASGAIADLGAITEVAHRSGALVLWDLSHTVGSFPVELDAAGVDLAVGCTYKYVNAGPGAPAFLYVNSARQRELRQPIWGWFGQREQFEMGPAYDPVPDIAQFLVGTPPVPGLAAVDEGVKLLAEAGIHALRTKGVALDVVSHRAARRVACPPRVRGRLAARSDSARITRVAASSRRARPVPGVDRARRDPRLPDAGSAPLRPGADRDAVRRRVGRDGLPAEPRRSVGLVPVRHAFAVAAGVLSVAAEVGHDPEDDEEPAPARDTDTRRIRERVDQRRPRKDQQPQERDDERVIGPVDEVGEDPHEDQRKPGRDQRDEKDETAHGRRLRRVR